MKVEIDASEVEYGAYYKDERCRKLEKILQSDSKYAECEVKRVHWDTENTDPFDVLDENGEGTVLLETWEVSTLSDSEILPYMEVKRIRDRPLTTAEEILYGASIAVGVTAGGLSIVVFLEGASVFQPDLAIVYVVTLICCVLTPILGIISARTYRRYILEKKNADLEAARKNPSFLDALRRLAQAPEAQEYVRKKLVKRIKFIEDELAGVNS